MPRSRSRPSAPPAPEALSSGPSSSKGSDDVLYERRKAVAWITIQRPDSLNAYTTETLAALAGAIRTATRDDRVGVIVLTGAGSRAFCTGGDVKEYAQRYTRRPHDYWQYMGTFQEVVEGLLHAGKPTIARLNGITVGGGNELHLACDLSVAASHIYLGQVGVGVGSVAAGGATQWLPLAIGDRRARRMLFLNERVPASQALAWGLVSEVAPSVRLQGRFLDNPTPDEITSAARKVDGYDIDLGRLDAQVDALADRLLAMFPECLRYTKQQVNYWKELGWNGTIGHAREWLALHFATREPLEGMSAFAEKRPPRVQELRDQLGAGGSVEFFHGPPLRDCPKCGARNLPEEFAYCGVCGSALRTPAGGPR